jgi:glycosyltransferase involved in cell wall biosynthesis
MRRKTVSSSSKDRFVVRRDSNAAADSLPRVAGPKILYVFQHTDFSGAETLHAPVIRADPDAVATAPPGSRMEEFVRSLGAEPLPLPFRALRHSGGRAETLRSVVRGIASARDLRRIVREHPDRRVVYSTSIRPGMLAAVSTLGLRRRHVWVLTDLTPPGLVGALTRALAWLACDAAIAISHTIRDDFAWRSRRLRRRTVVVYPGVAPRDERDRVAATPASAAIVGHVSPTKRTDVAIDVARRVAERHPGFELTILGRAQYRDEDFAYERDLQDRVGADPLLRDSVRFEGWVADVPGALSTRGMLFHARPDEPLGMVLLEAMAGGLPVVAPGSAGPAEIVVDGETGLLYPPGDVDAAASAVLSLVSDPALANRLGAAGRRRVEERFSAELQLEGFVGVLEAVARGAGGRGGRGQPASSS